MPWPEAGYKAFASCGLRILPYTIDMQQLRLLKVAGSIFTYATAGFDGGIVMVTKAEAGGALIRKHKIVSSIHVMGCHQAVPGM
jgi:hypothetical protein